MAPPKADAQVCRLVPILFPVIGKYALAKSGCFAGMTEGGLGNFPVKISKFPVFGG
jgi:hypothetical protein